MRRYEDIEKDGNVLRKCSVCGNIYPATSEFFNKNKVCKLGLDYRCNGCRKQYRKDNAAHIKECGKAYREKEKEYFKKYRREYYAKNKEEVLLKCKAYRDNHKEEKKVADKIYRDSHKKEIKEIYDKWYLKNRERISESRKGHCYIHKPPTEETRQLQRQRYARYHNVHERTNNKIAELGIRPKICPVCGKSGRIEAHHPDYSKWYLIVFCCTSCHSRIHSGWFECPEIINLSKLH